MIYKIIAKCLLNRLRPCLEHIIHPFQSAFVTGCQIHDNILIAHEIMNKFKNTKGKNTWTAIKLNMKKAYNIVEWDFLIQCIIELDFPYQWTNWIRQCISTVSYSIIVNNQPMDLLDQLVVSVKEIHYRLTFS